jgi:hypothetical protein
MRQKIKMQSRITPPQRQDTLPNRYTPFCEEFRPNLCTPAEDGLRSGQSGHPAGISHAQSGLGSMAGSGIDGIAGLLQGGHQGIADTEVAIR